MEGEEQPSRELEDGGVVVGEDDAAVGPMELQELLDDRQFAARGEREPPLFAVGREGCTAVGGAGGEGDEAGPAAGRGHADSVLAHEVEVALAGCRVVFEFGLRHGDPERLDGVVGEELSGELADLAAVDGGPHSLVEQEVAVVGPLGGGGEAEPEGGEEVVGRQDVGGAGEVVDLVVDHQAEAVADAFGVDVEGVVGGDGDRLDLVRASAEESHLGEPEVGAEAVMPLEHEVDGGNDDEGVAGGGGDGEVGDE